MSPAKKAAAAQKTMRAAWYDRQGDPRETLTLGELPVPVPGVGEARVRIAVSGVNPGDAKKRNGALGPMAFPRIVPHSDGAGTIDAVGEGVDEKRIGERVWVFNAQSGRAGGTAAEYAVVPAGFAIRLADAVDFETGASLGVPARTAWLALFGDGTIQGSTVIVSGAAGNVGRAAVELASLAGARVIGVVRNLADVDEVRGLGAALVLNSEREDVAERVRTFTEEKGVERILEVALDANAHTDLRMLAVGGTIAAYASGAPLAPVPFWEGVAKGARVRFIAVDLIEGEQLLGIADIAQAIEAGGLRPKIAERLPLERIAEAHVHVESGKAKGKVLLTL